MHSRGSYRGAILLALALLGGCARPRVQAPERRLSLAVPAAPAAPAALSRLGFTLQAGAFAEVAHAARLARRLQSEGLDAAYYAAPGGLYRVRFGDFATATQARAKGEALRRAGLLGSFWVVPPGPREAPGPKAPLPGLSAPGLRERLVDTARSYLGVPYLFGGTTPLGFDCSGLTSAVYRLNGLALPRSSEAQYEAGRSVPLRKARPGDLLFFATCGGHQVSHVALYLGHGQFIHAPPAGEEIREDRLTEPYFERTFVGARTYFQR